MRRRYSRFLPEESRIVLSGPHGLVVEGKVVDESYAGLGFLATNAAGLEEGLEVEVEFDGGHYEAVVVSLHPQAEEGTHVGVKWIGEFADDPQGEEEEQPLAEALLDPDRAEMVDADLATDYEAFDSPHRQISAPRPSAEDDSPNANSSPV